MCLTHDSRSNARSASATVTARAVDPIRVATRVAASQRTGASGAGVAGSTKGAQMPTCGLGTKIGGTPDQMAREQGLRRSFLRRQPGVIALVVWVSAQELPCQFDSVEGQNVVIGTVRRRPGWLHDRLRTWHRTAPLCMARPAPSGVLNTYSRWPFVAAAPAQICDGTFR